MNLAEHIRSHRYNHRTANIAIVIGVVLIAAAIVSQQPIYGAFAGLLIIGGIVGRIASNSSLNTHIDRAIAEAIDIPIKNVEANTMEQRKFNIRIFQRAIMLSEALGGTIEDHLPNATKQVSIGVLGRDPFAE